MPVLDCTCEHIAIVNAERPGARTRAVRSNPLKADPTRTLMLRLRFQREFTKRLDALKGKINQLVVVEDAFGLREKPLFNEEQSDEYARSAGRREKIDEEAKYVATISGGSEPLPVLPNSAYQVDALLRVESIPLVVPSAVVLDGDGVLRSRQINDGRYGQNCQSGNAGRLPSQPQLATNQRFAFRTDPQKVIAFQGWLRTQVRSDFLPEVFTVDPSGVASSQALEDAYWTKYVEQGYEKGQGRAFDQTRRPLGGEGVSDFYRGTKQEFLRSSFGRPVAIDKVKGLAGRVFTDLKGIDSAMETQMSRVLTDGLAQGKNPKVIARELNNRIEKIGKTRTKQLAQTEIIRAHAEGQLDAFERLGVEEVGVMAEWSTAGDDRVCPLCQALESNVMTVKEARGLIPRHVSCRCVWIPANVGEPRKATRRVLFKDPATGQIELKTVSQQRSAGALARSRDRSIRAEIPKGQRGKRSLAEQKQRTTWVGADKRFAKTRPKSVLEPAPAVKPTPKPRTRTAVKPKPPTPKAPRIVPGFDTIESFAAKARAGTVPPTNLLGQKKFSRLIVSKEKVLIEGARQDALVIFDVIAKDTGQGAFTKALAELKGLGLPIRIDNVTTKKFMDGLLRRGFKPHGKDGAVWVPGKGKVPKAKPKKPTRTKAQDDELKRKLAGERKATRRSTAGQKGESAADIKQARRAVAEEFGVAETDVKMAMDDVWEAKSSEVRSSIRAKESIHKIAHLSPADVRKLDNAGFDFSANRSKILTELGDTKEARRLASSLEQFDVRATEAARHHPELGFGDPDSPGSNLSGELWDVLREPKARLPGRADASLLREAAEIVQQGGGSAGIDSGLGFVDDIPF